MDYHIIIPARYASTRFPGKPLVDIAGMSMLEHTWRRASQSAARSVIIATDDQRVYAAASEFCDQVMMTRSSHQSGTDRLAEVVQKMAWEADTLVVNVQGDEPLVKPKHIDQVAKALSVAKDAGISTLKYAIQSYAELFDPNLVKVVCDAEGYALYFSRAPIPWLRDDFQTLSGSFEISRPFPANTFYRHIGMYAYRVKTLLQYPALAPAPLESLESLEQLRAMFNGIRIMVVETDEQPGHGVDVPADLEIVSRLIEKEQE